MATGSLNTGLDTFTHILSSVAQLLHWNGGCNIHHGLLLPENQFRLNVSNLVLDKFPDKGVKRIEI